MKPNYGSAVVGGMVGTIAMSMMMMFVAPMMDVHMDIAKNLADMMGASWMVGMLAHVMLGAIIFPAIFVFVLLRYQPGSPLNKGLILGGVLWLMLEILLMPMMGMGIFGSAGPGMKGAVAALVAHLIYGAALGGVFAWGIEKPTATAA
jgi:uncharacterized membrane protein YagU involved in acid resistance